MTNKALLVTGIILICIGIVLISLFIVVAIKSYYSFSNNYLSYWNLADRSSTLVAKEQYITQFVGLLEKDRAKFSDYNAIFLITPENNFDNNLKAITTLKNRLIDVKDMKEDSFEYQTAIQQITAQEQGEAENIIIDIKGSYVLKNYTLVWEWIGIVILISLIMLISAGFVLIVLYVESKKTEESEEYL